MIDKDEIAAADRQRELVDALALVRADGARLKEAVDRVLDLVEKIALGLGIEVGTEG